MTKAYEFKTNGYECKEEWKEAIKRFDIIIKEKFPYLKAIYHFNYANLCIMTTVQITEKEYCGFRIGSKIAYLDGYCLSDENYKICEGILER